MRRLIATTAAAALLAAPALAETKVGLVTTLSGGGAGLGLDIRDGFMLGIEMSGRDDIEVEVADDQQKPEIAVQVVDEFILRDDVDVVTGPVFSNIAMAIVPSVTGQGKFYLSPNAGPSAFAGARCHENYFNVSWQNDALHEAAGAYANSAGYANAFILAPNYPAGVDALNGFKRLYEGELAGEVMTTLGQTDYAAEIAQIRASGADATYFFLPGGMGIAFLKQYADSGVDIPLIGPAFSFDQTILAAAGEAAMGVKNTSQWNKDLDNAANAEFVPAFEEKYGRLPSVYASQSYDTARLLVSALEKAEVSDADAFRDALREADFESVRGDFRFGPNQHPIQDYFIRTVVEEDGVITNESGEMVLEDHADAYAADCTM